MTIAAPAGIPVRTFSEQREIIKADLLGKFQRQDWHGVMDCAADLRELDAFERGRNEAILEYADVQL